MLKEQDRKNAGLEIDAIDALKVRPGHFETCWQIPPDLAHGSIKRFGFNSGIQLYVNDYTTLSTFGTRDNSEEPVFGFRYCICGETRLDIRSFQKGLRIRSNEAGFFYFPSGKISHEDPPGCRVYKVLIMMTPSSFISMMEEGLSPGLRSGIPRHDSDTGKAPFNLTGPITPAMRTILEQIARCPYEGAVRRIFIEAKAMELMVCKLDQIKSPHQDPVNHSSLRSGDIDRVHYAGQLLSNNLGAPPSTGEIARAVGVSRSKLYQDFTRFFGVSPMEYFRVRRLEKARALVCDKDLSMTQIAHSLGYSSSSHFAKVFKENFGMPPSRFRRQNHKNRRLL